MIEDEREEPEPADRSDHERSEEAVVPAPQGEGHAQLHPECEVVDRFDLPGVSVAMQARSLSNSGPGNKILIPSAVNRQ